MASLRDIRRRIKSIQNTQKITQAMRMVAAAKVRKAENKVKAARPFSNELLKSFQRLLASHPEVHNTSLNTAKAIDNYPALLHTREQKTVGLLVITSDRGLAGAYNTNIVRRTIARVKELKAQGLEVKLFVVGLKGLNALKRTGYQIVENYVKMPAMPTAGEAFVIAEDIAGFYIKGEIDKIEVITTQFKSMLSYEVQIWQLLPVIPPKEENAAPHAEMIFDPDPETVLQKIVPLYISNRIYQALLESSASEQAARMQSMANATKNASDMIQHLTIVYNKARQASITQEILEVVSGAQALT